MTFTERNGKGNFGWSMTALTENTYYHFAVHLLPVFPHFSSSAVLLEPGFSVATLGAGGLH